MRDVSIVIPTCNSARTIAQCLNSISEQTEAFKDLVVVDRFSTDATPNIARGKGATVLQTNANRSVARNIGASESSGTGVLFVDADMILSKNLIKDCADGILVDDALVIPEVSTGRGFWAKCKEFDKRLSIRNELAEAPRCFRKTAFHSLGGYNPTLEAGEDWDLTIRARLRGIRIGRTAATIVHDEGDLKLVNALRKKYGYGKTFGKYLRNHPRVGFRQVNPMSRILAPSLKAIREDPSHGAGLLMLKSLEFCAAGIGQLRSMNELETQSVPTSS